MFVKICGITRPEDVEVAKLAGADAIGVNLFAQSKRFVASSRQREELKQAAAGLLTVAVLVNPTAEETEQALGIFDCVQLHGQESPEWLAELIGKYGERAYKAIAVTNEAALAQADAYGGRFLLLDAPAEAMAAFFGGSGKSFDWSLATAMGARHRVLLAGGLVPENVAAAIAVVKPYGVDVASGVEAAPGKKDPDKVKRFIDRAKRAI